MYSTLFRGGGHARKLTYVYMCIEERRAEILEEVTLYGVFKRLLLVYSGIGFRRNSMAHDWAKCFAIRQHILLI